jgi:hypothetical protein
MHHAARLPWSACLVLPLVFPSDFCKIFCMATICWSSASTCAPQASVLKIEQSDVELEGELFGAGALHTHIRQ